MKNVNIAELKAKLSEYLRQVRRGRVLTVMDRTTPIAELVPYRGASESIRIRHRLKNYSRLSRVPLPPPLEIDLDVVDLLLEERQGER
jgi:prevent-host-death family protein